nr:C-type lectin 37Da-like [Aedes albopictus]
MKGLLPMLIFVGVVTALSEYYIPPFKANWFKAREICNSFDMTFMSIATQNDHDKLVDFVKKSGKFSEKLRLWIGGSDHAENGTFSWASTGRMFTFNRWGYHKPNYANETENCVEMIYWPSLDWEWHWQNSNCIENKSYFVCKSNHLSCVDQFR